MVVDVYKMLENLRNLHAYRYKYFVDSSPQGIECKYAKATELAYGREYEVIKLRNILIELRAKIDEILDEIKDCK